MYVCIFLCICVCCRRVSLCCVSLRVSVVCVVVFRVPICSHFVSLRAYARVRDAPMCVRAHVPMWHF